MHALRRERCPRCRAVVAAAMQRSAWNFASPKSSSFAPAFVSITFDGFRVAMHDAGAVRRVERAADLDRRLQRLVERQRSALQASRPGSRPRDTP